MRSLRRLKILFETKNITWSFLLTRPMIPIQLLSPSCPRASPSYLWSLILTASLFMEWERYVVTPSPKPLLSSGGMLERVPVFGQRRHQVGVLWTQSGTVVFL